MRKRSRSYRLLPLSIAAALAVTIDIPEANATGYFINQQSVRGLGRVDAGNVAAANDPGTIFFNPAGMTGLWREHDETHRNILGLGASVIVPRSDLDNAGTTATTPGTLGTPVPVSGPNQSDPSDPAFVPQLYFARNMLNRDLVLGIGVTAPFGLSAEYDRDWFGRYDAIEASLQTVNVGPAIAYKINDVVSIGGGIDFQYADSELEVAIPNPLTPGGPTPATDGTFRAEGDDWTVGFNLGLIIEPSSSLRIGLHYRSEMDHDIEGTATTSGLTGPLAALNGTTDATTTLELPWIAGVGVAWEVNHDLSLYGDVTVFGWSDQDEVRISFSNGAPDVVRTPNFRDTYAVALGAEYRLNANWQIRGGMKYDRTPTTDGSRDTTFADDDRFWLGIGATYQPSKAIAIDVAFTHVFVDDTQVVLDRDFFTGSPLASSVAVDANVESTVNTIAIGLRYAF